MKRVLVIGVGSLGSRVLQQLQTEGVEAIGASRTHPRGVFGEWSVLDARDSDEVSRRAHGADAVILCAAPPLNRWSKDFEDLVRGTLVGLRDLDTTLVSASSMAPYGRCRGAFSESSPEHPIGPMGQLRHRLDQLTLAAHQPKSVRNSGHPPTDAHPHSGAHPHSVPNSDHTHGPGNNGGGLHTAVVRSGSFYGPGVDVSMVGSSQIAAAARGRKIDALGSVDQPHSLTYIDDFARALVRVATDPAAHGQVWHAPAQPAMTVREFMTRVTTELALAEPPRFRIATPLTMSALGMFNPTIRALKEGMRPYTGPFLVDDSRYRAAFADTATPFGETMRATLVSEGLSTIRRD